MESSTYNDKKLESYLRNELPEYEIAALEDELLRDDALFQRLETIEMNLIDSYLEDEMTDDEKRRFEATFLSNPANQWKLHEASVFGESLERLREKEPTTQKVAKTAITAVERKAFFGSIRRPELAAAAVVLILIAVLIAWLAFRLQNQNPDSLSTKVVPPPTPESSPTSLEQPSPPPSPSHGSTERKPPKQIDERWLYLREDRTGVMGAGDDLRITISPDTESLRLRFELLDDARDRNSFRVSLKDRMGYPVLATSEISPTTVRHRGLLRRTISLDVPVKDLKTGERYRFQIAEPYAFRIFVLDKKPD